MDGLNKKGFVMIIIGFSSKTSLFIPRLLCKNFKHCVVITPNNDNLTLYQFTHRHNITRINITSKEIARLRKFGWVFLYIPKEISYQFNPDRARTCVDMAKQALHIKNKFIITPDSLFKYLCHNS